MRSTSSRIRFDTPATLISLSKRSGCASRAAFSSASAASRWPLRKHTGPMPRCWDTKPLKRRPHRLQAVFTSWSCGKTPRALRRVLALGALPDTSASSRRWIAPWALVHLPPRPRRRRDATARACGADPSGRCESLVVRADSAGTRAPGVCAGTQPSRHRERIALDRTRRRLEEDACDSFCGSARTSGWFLTHGVSFAFHVSIGTRCRTDRP